MVTTYRNSVYTRTATQGGMFLAGSFNLKLKNSCAYDVCMNCKHSVYIGKFSAIFPRFSCDNCHFEHNTTHLEVTSTPLFKEESEPLSPLSREDFLSEHNIDSSSSFFDLNEWINHTQNLSSASSRLSTSVNFLDVLTEEALEDAKKRLRSFLPWIFSETRIPQSFISHYVKIPEKVDVYVNLFEDLLILISGILTARNTAQRYLCVITFCKLRGMKPSFSTAILYMLGDLVTSSLLKKNKKDPLHDHVMEQLSFDAQNDDDDESDNPFRSFRAILDRWDQVKNSPLWKKVYKMSMFILSTEILQGLKIDFKTFNFNEYESKVISRTHRPGLDMFHCIYDTILFICERAYDCYKYNDVNMLFQSSGKYEKWIIRAHKLMSDSKFLSNPEPHGINRFEFIANLKDTIEKGTNLSKFLTNLDKTERVVLNKLLCDLRLVESNELTRKAAQQPRKDPFAILLHGSSSICKSQLKQILFYHYGKIFGHPTSAEYMYTRCPTDEYWSGFNSTQWCIVMDDIAFLNPANGELDPTLAELLQVKNSVPYTPPQAALEDKGRTPVRAELLIGTTNTKHLNLVAYFACPFAIARRLNYVVTAKVKPQYAKNGFMADSSLIPPTPVGEYMDIWDFEISEPRPAEEEPLDRQNTRYAPIANFDNIHDFLVWYIEMAKKHEVSQEKALSADTSMSTTDVCKTCYRLKNRCNCFDDQSQTFAEYGLDNFSGLAKFKLAYLGLILKGESLGVWQYFKTLPFHLIWSITMLFLIIVYTGIYRIHMILLVILLLTIDNSSFILRMYYNYKLGSRYELWLSYRFFKNEHQAHNYLLKLAKERWSNIHVPQFPKYIWATMVGTPMILLIAKVFKNYLYSSESEGVKPTPLSEEKPTFYYHDPYKPTDMEISSQSKTCQGDRLREKISKNVAKFVVDMGSRKFRTQALNIHGNIWLFNSHSIRGETIESIDVIFDPIEQNVSRNIYGIKVVDSMYHIHGNSDIITIQLRCIPPGSNLIPYFPLKDQIKGDFNGEYFLISPQGVRSSNMIMHITPVSKTPLFGTKGYIGKVSINTKDGDCGAPLLVKIGTAQIILGIHCAGSQALNKVVAHHIDQDMLKSMIECYDMQVERGSVPIDAPGYPRTIVPLHPKSNIRFVQQGNAHVVGSFAGYRPKHKSKVSKTYICDEVAKLGYSSDFGAPDMSWKPWSLAINDMLSVKHTYDESIIKACEDAFFVDIKTALGDKINMLEVYSLDVALNGVDGITYVDRLNTATSAGNPFKCSKKKFLEFDENNRITGVDKVIMDRVEDIEQAYAQGKRFHIQFCDHLKDEALPFSKIDLGKTRQFSGSEMPGSLVIRKYTLSHIRLIQNNPYVFEAMPGVVAQSRQWDELYNYVTAHGADRIVAGDYAKFDKRMAAPFILSAFNVLLRLAEAAGWSNEDLQILKCISYDIAFPWHDFNGDLIEVQGNPSGHPLTVIINCLVNSLYIRYAYHDLGGDLSQFKKDVNLATYGDDNIMNIHPDNSFFHHTSIAQSLEKIGVVYTMADKEAESVPLIHIKDASFLKRKFIYDKHIKSIVAPLEHKSIEKMLTVGLISDNVSPEAHAIAIIETAVREYFFYGRSTFITRKRLLEKVVENLGLTPYVKSSTFPNYYLLVYEFWIKTETQKVALEKAKLSLTTLEKLRKQTYCDGLTDLTEHDYE